jgi:hypothetical protein
MQTGSLRSGTACLVLVLLFAPFVRAQESPPALPGLPTLTPAEPKPPPHPPAAPLIDGKLPVAEPLEPTPDPPPVSHPVDGVHVEPEPPAEGPGLEFWGEYLFLKARRNALDFALLSPTPSATLGGSVEALDWQARSGFAAGTGWRLPNTEWQLAVNYTYFHTSDERILTAPDGGALLATLPARGAVGLVGTASAESNLNYQVLDLDLRRRVSLVSDFDLNLFGGGRFAWIDQKFDVLYNGVSASNYAVSSPVSFRGGGVSIGGDGFWNIWRGAGLYARARGSILSGQFRNQLNETGAAGTAAAQPAVAVRDQSYDLIPVTEVGLGVAYRGEHMIFSVGYEMSNWYNMVNSPDFSSPTGQFNRRSSDLMLEGLAVQLGFMY